METNPGLSELEGGEARVMRTRACSVVYAGTLTLTAWSEVEATTVEYVRPPSPEISTSTVPDPVQRTVCCEPAAQRSPPAGETSRTEEAVYRRSSVVSSK